MRDTSFRLSFPVILALTAFEAVATEMLFPEPLHLRREVHDPISGTVTTVDQYCIGNRIVSVAAGRVAITDYAREELTEIDRDAATFSITPFRDIAAAAGSMPQTSAKSTAAAARPLPSKRSADGRTLEAFEFVQRANGEMLTVEVAVDRQVTLPAAAVEALIGAAFPNRRGLVHDAMMRAAAPSSTPGRRMQTTSAESYSLPFEYAVTTEAGGERLTFRTIITAVNRTVPAPELVTIPPGATRVESRLVAVPRALQEIDGVRPRTP